MLININSLIDKEQIKWISGTYLEFAKKWENGVFCIFWNILFLVFPKKSEMKNHTVISVWQQTFLTKLSFSSYGEKCSQPVGLQNYLRYNISG